VLPVASALVTKNVLTFAAIVQTYALCVRGWRPVALNFLRNCVRYAAKFATHARKLAANTLHTWRPAKHAQKHVKNVRKFVPSWLQQLSKISATCSPPFTRVNFESVGRMVRAKNGFEMRV
jgi:hypothetical protein